MGLCAPREDQRSQSRPGRGRVLGRGSPSSEELFSTTGQPLSIWSSWRVARRKQTCGFQGTPTSLMTVANLAGSSSFRGSW